MKRFIYSMYAAVGATIGLGLTFLETGTPLGQVTTTRLLACLAGGSVAGATALLWRPCVLASPNMPWPALIFWGYWVWGGALFTALCYTRGVAAGALFYAPFIFVIMFVCAGFAKQTQDLTQDDTDDS